MWQLAVARQHQQSVRRRGINHQTAWDQQVALLMEEGSHNPYAIAVALPSVRAGKRHLPGTCLGHLHGK